MLDRSPLGKATAYPDRYDRSLLFRIERGPQRDALGLGATSSAGLRPGLPFSGEDLWTAYELSWLDRAGTPRVAIAEIRVPAESPAIVESKSLKLYLGSFAQETFDEPDALKLAIERDLGAVCGSAVAVALTPSSAFDAASIATRDSAPEAEFGGESIDDLPLGVAAPGTAADDAPATPRAADLRTGGAVVDETLCSALFRSLCPVTGQPDYADMLIRYRGARIDRASLLRYLISYRQHAAFHEDCVERIFVDIARSCRPERLTVYARFTRRGGIDINPFRSNFERAPTAILRTPRQ